MFAANVNVEIKDQENYKSGTRVFQGNIFYWCSFSYVSHINDKRQTVRKNENQESDFEDDFELDDVSKISQIFYRTVPVGGWFSCHA